MNDRSTPPEGFVPVRALAWPDLVLLSDVLRRLGHDQNNALAPAFCLVDLMRFRHKPTAAAPDLDRLSECMVALRGLGATTVAQTLRLQRDNPPTMAEIHTHHASAAITAQVALRWRASPGPQAPIPAGLDGHQASLLLQCLLSNAFQAHAADSRDLKDGAPRVTVHFESDEADTLRVLRVEDDGPGCSDLSAAANARLHRHGTGHLGVGLLTASTLVERGGGTLYIGDRSPCGFAARAFWPRADVRARA